MMLHQGRRICVVLSALAPLASALCNRTALLAFADDYVLAHENGQLGHLQNIADNFTYYENNRTIDITSGVFNNAFVIDHRRTTVDLVECATFTELVVTRNVSGEPAPHVIGTQIRHSSEDMSCYMMDMIATTTGHWLFNATQTLYWVRRESWDPLPEADRSSRSVLRAAADAYLDMWSSATAEAAVPWGTPCARLEGSAYTGSGSATDSCKPGIPTNHSQAPNINRRYVIDEELGSASVLCIFDHLQHAPDSHEFRLEKGKLRYVHTMTVASSAGSPIGV